MPISSRTVFLLVTVSLAGSIGLLTTHSASAQTCSEDILCLHAIEDGQQMHLELENRSVGTVTLRLGLALENTQASVALPLVMRIAGETRLRVLTLTAVDAYQEWGYRSDLEWIYGDLEARHDDTHAYALPFAPGDDVLVGQGYDGDFSHQGRYALDFNLEEGTPILAARGGVVVDLKDSYGRGGPDPTLRQQANFIAIQHADGTVAQYAHLQRGGARVQVGQRVRAGQVIGLSGTTGYTTGPHLHLEVFRIGPDLTRRSIPVVFRTAADPRAVLEAGRTYQHGR